MIYKPWPGRCILAAAEIYGDIPQGLQAGGAYALAGHALCNIYHVKVCRGFAKCISLITPPALQYSIMVYNTIILPPIYSKII